MVTHVDVSREECERATGILAEVALQKQAATVLV